jgi:hypothetical protein
MHNFWKIYSVEDNLTSNKIAESLLKRGEISDTGGRVPSLTLFPLSSAQFRSP